METKKVLESTMKQLHREYCIAPHNTQLCVWESGKITRMSQAMDFDGEPKGLIFIMNAQGLGNIDCTEYSDGWAVLQENGEYFSAIDDEFLTTKEMVLRAIDEGEWSELYESWAQNLADEINYNSDEKVKFEIVWGE